mgnify:CR=1 FL=1
MRNVLAICKRELLSFFVSPIAYFVITGFMLLVGFFFFNYLAFFARMYEMSQMMAFRGGQVPNLNQTVIEGLYQTMLVILVFLIPLLTMRIVAEKTRNIRVTDYFASVGFRDCDRKVFKSRGGHRCDARASYYLSPIVGGVRVSGDTTNSIGVCWSRVMRPGLRQRGNGGFIPDREPDRGGRQ